jgi:hypothetical protein
MDLRALVIDLGGVVAAGHGARRCAAMQFCRADNVVKEVVDDRAFLLDARGVEMIVLNPVGTMVWDALDRPRDASAIAASLVDRFVDVSLEDLERDVEAFLEELRDAGLVVPFTES